jgi:C-terminal of NADH-ubiquinone oxidoreductase 21 kDa subunit
MNTKVPLVGARFWRLTTALGFLGGFLVSYQDSCSTSLIESTNSERFWGWTENAREVKMDMEEMTGRLRAGLPLYGYTSLDPYNQQVAATQSRFAQLKFRMISSHLELTTLDIFPFLNFANHNVHGVDVAKYIRAMPESEQEHYRKQLAAMNSNSAQKVEEEAKDEEKPEE